MVLDDFIFEQKHTYYRTIVLVEVEVENALVRMKTETWIYQEEIRWVWLTRFLSSILKKKKKKKCKINGEEML